MGKRNEIGKHRVLTNRIAKVATTIKSPFLTLVKAPRKKKEAMDRLRSMLNLPIMKQIEITARTSPYLVLSLTIPFNERNLF